GDELETRLVVLDAEGVPGGADELTRRLRTGDPPIVARIEDGRVLIDPRTVPSGRDAELAAAVSLALALTEPR
ncbi:MAG: L-seryl-tRNA(Sec) selenium transferase, partial [Chloroflexi bacterium]|nr:L-seryl-tRNA(Sec) selenium transferase [Chloroflexota bacterium]